MTIDPAHYQVSNFGRVRSLGFKGNGIVIQAKILDEHFVDGYPTVTLRTELGKRRTVKVYRLVARYFMGPNPAGMFVCHNNGVKGDSKLSNLRFDTPSSNANDHVLHGNHFQSKKTHCKRGHPLEQPNLKASQLRNGRRLCLACEKANGYKYRQLKKGNMMSEQQVSELADREFDKIQSQE